MAHSTGEGYLAQTEQVEPCSTCERGLIIYRPLGVAVHSLTHLSLCVLSVAQELLLEKHHFLGQHGDYPVDDPGYMNLLQTNIIKGLFYVRKHARYQTYRPCFQSLMVN